MLLKNINRSTVFFNSSGKEFQTSEALTEKALSPNVLYLAVFVTMTQKYAVPYKQEVLALPTSSNVSSNKKC